VNLPSPSFLALALSVWLSLATISTAQLEELEDYQTALRALQDELPSVAADKLQRLHADPTQEFSQDERRQLKLKLIESMARAGRAEQALALCADPVLEDDPTMLFWKAAALTGLGRLQDAEQQLLLLSGRPNSPLFANAALSRASLLELLEDPKAALKALEPVLSNPPGPKEEATALLKAAELHLNLGEPEEAERILKARTLSDPDLLYDVRYLRGNIALAEGRYADARPIFKQLAEDTEEEHRPLYVDAVIGLADALAGEEKVDEAVDLLVSYINQAPKGISLGEAFQRLETLGFFQRPRVQAVLDSWAKSDNQSLQALTLYFGARSDRSKAIKNLERFRQQHGDHFLFPAAMLKLADLYLDTNKPEKAEEILRIVSARSANPEVQRYISHLSGRANFAFEEFAIAIEDFQASTDEDTPEELFNEAVAALYANQPSSFDQAAKVLSSSQETKAIEANLALERGLYLASSGRGGAISALKSFAKAYPDHPRIVEAEIALAELYLLEFPPKPISARAQLDSARARDLPPAVAEQADYVAIWIEAASRNDQTFINAALHFLDNWEDSPRYAEVEMKLAEIYFARKDYANAQTHFELVAAHDPDGKYSETALFFAGKAASLTMNDTGIQQAIELWGRVVDRKGPLAEEARRQQGLTKLKQDQPDDAIAVFERVLEAKNLDPRIRMATLTNMGQALLRKADGNVDPTTLLVKAIGVYDEILDSEEANRYWRNQAAVNKARCMERTRDYDSALEVYYDVVNIPPEMGLRRNEAPEYTWYYRAGFSAIELLRRQEKWPAAVKLAERLSQTSGPRAQEAREISTQLRLEHFIPWDSPLE